MAKDDPSPATGRGSGSDNTFFDWMRRLDVPRQPGWIGGVCAGVAARLGIDAVIVRGIVVVIAVLGGPALLLYAAAWLLLPDSYNRIHLEEAIRGTFDKAIAGIGVMLLLSFLPIAQGITWWQTSITSDGWLVGPSIWGFLWTLAIIGSIVWFIVWLSNRAKTGNQTSTPGAASAVVARSTTSAHSASAEPSASGEAADTEPTDTAQTVATDAPPTPPGSAPPTGAPADELAAWKEQQAGWKREHAEWRARQAAGERELQQQRLTEDRRARQELNAERRRVHIEQEQRTRSNPIYSLVAIGLAIIGGAATAIAIGGSDWNAKAAITGMAVSLGVLGLAIVVNGFRGKRSGGSGGVAFLVVIALFVTSFLNWASGPLNGDAIEWAPSHLQDSSPRRTVATGNVTLDLTGYFENYSANGEYQNGKVDLYVGRGDVDVIMPADENSEVKAFSLNGSIDLADAERRTEHGPFASGSEDFDPSEDMHRDLFVNIWVASGDITISQATR